ncbi:MAG: hypothetical protein H7289_13290 [Mucilaginibacter sp.]|nr:hypothetical protein [Mucilaginibacter sp.]
METTAYNDPVDDQITNNDTSVTNKDGDNDLEQGQQPIEQNNSDPARVSTVAPENYNEDTASETNSEDDISSNKGEVPKGETL